MIPLPGRFAATTFREVAPTRHELLCASHPSGEARRSRLESIHQAKSTVTPP
jgi:hypothetical protein